MKNLVLGLVKGYSYEQIRPFVASLRGTGYAGDICFMYADIAEDAVRRLREFGVEMVPFEMGTLNLALKRVYIFSLLNRIYQSPVSRLVPTHKIYAGLVDALSRRDGLSKYRLAAKTFNVYCVRYPLYYLYLAGHRGRYANVLMSDVRDVIFQRDPFDFDIRGELCFFLEDDRTTIKECRYNSLWLRTGYGDQALRELGDEIVSCSGVTIGGYDAVMRYLELMVDHTLRLKYHPSGMDQGVHNYLLYKRALENVRVYPNGLGPVLTMGKTVDLPTGFDGGGAVLNLDGSVAHVLHQYDRHIEHGKLALVEEGETVRLVAP